MSDRPEDLPPEAPPGEGVDEGAAEQPAEGGAEAPFQFEERPPVTIDAPPTPSFEETRVTEALGNKRQLKRRLKRAKLKAHVVVRRADAPPVTITMDRNELVFGRDAAECDIVLDGPVVSRRHARIDRDGAGYYTLRDCQSRNGTYYEGRPVRSMNLVDGDVFEIGENAIEFHTG